MLAGQQKGDIGVDRPIAAALGGVAHAREKLAGDLPVGSVRPREHTAGDQRKTERAVPGLEGL